MARRVTWTNNSTSYDGTNIYRDTTIDPQNLPEPIATVDPVAQGATVEYIDLTGSGDQCYAVRDFDSSGDGALSEVYCFEEDIFADAEIGDEYGGGIYAGTIEYTDGRKFEIIFAKQDGEDASIQWAIDEVVTGATDEDDGEANTAAIEAAGLSNHPAAEHCRNYTDSQGNSDYYLPARNELALEENLRGHPELSTETTEYRWESTEVSEFSAYIREFSSGTRTFSNKTASAERRARPIRRIPV